MVTKQKDNETEMVPIEVGLTADMVRDAQKYLDTMSDEDAWPDGVPGSSPVGGKLGVLQRIITAVREDKEYRQILLLAAFDDKQEALLVADAIDEREMFGVDIKPLLNRVVCQCAVRADRIQRVLNAMSQHSIFTNPGGNGKGWLPDWKRRQDNNMMQ